MKNIKSIALCLTFTSLMFCKQTANEIKTEGPRPLNDALQSLEDEFKTPLFYEEMPHENEADLVPGSVLGMNPAHHFIKLRKLDAMIVEPSSFDSAINDVLSAYHSQNLPGTYSKTSYQSMIAVIPRTMLNVKGSQTTISPLLETHIAVPKVSRTRTDTLAAILDAISKSANHRLNYLPFESDIKKIVFGAEDEASGSVLARLQEEFGPFTCHLIYDPQTREYYANFRWLSKEQTLTEPPALGPKHNDPYFIISK